MTETATESRDLDQCKCEPHLHWLSCTTDIKSGDVSVFTVKYHAGFLIPEKGDDILKMSESTSQK